MGKRIIEEWPWRGVAILRRKMGERRERRRMIVAPCELDPRRDVDSALNSLTHNTTAPCFPFTNTITLGQVI